MASNHASPAGWSRRWLATVAIAIALAALIGCGDLAGAGYLGHDAAIKENASHTIGREPTDAEIRKACRSFQSSGWNYQAAAMQHVTATDGTMEILAAITVIAGGDSQDYCESKLN